MSPKISTFILSHRVAHLATADERGRPHVIPICYAYDGEAIYSAIDDKPKRVSWKGLRRVKNIRVNPQASLVIDDYSEDWSKLAYVMIQGRASLLTEGPDYERAVNLLRDKYPQYRIPPYALVNPLVIKIKPEGWVAWGGIGSE